jgi:hypothetical protein
MFTPAELEVFIDLLSLVVFLLSYVVLRRTFDYASHNCIHCIIVICHYHKWNATKLFLE